METEHTRQEKSRESVRRWYAAHREEYAELRRKRYRSNPKLRAAARKAAAQYRQARKKGLRVKRTLTRTVNGVPIEVYTSGYVADRIKVSTQMLRGWEARGWIPPSIFTEEKHRLYTARQMALMRLLADTLKAKAKAGRRAEQPVLDEVINVIHRTWKVVDNGGQNRQKARRSRS